MRPAAFEYIRVASLDEAVAALQAGNGEASILSGGQSLIPAMNLRLARPGTLVDIGGIPGLDGISIESDAIRIGARVTHADIEHSMDLAQALPVLAEMARHIAHPAVRNRGTFGGSLAHADPASEWPCALVGLGGSVDVVGAGGVRTIDAVEFFQGLLTTSLAADEVLIAATVPRHGADWRWSFRELARQSGAFGLVLVLAGVRLGADHTIAEVRLSVGGCDTRPIAPLTDWSFLAGNAPTPELLDEAALRIAGALDPMDDLQFGAEERRAVARTLVRRALGSACSLTPGESR